MKKKIVAAAILMGIVLLFGACAAPEGAVPPKEEASSEALPDASGQEKAMQIRFPASLFTFMGSAVEETQQAFLEEGDRYCEAVEIDGGDLIVTMTPAQKERLLEDYDAFLAERISAFLAEDENYRFEGSADYTSFSLYYDEDIPTNLEAFSLLGIISGYGIRRILTENDPDWSVHCRVVNCHTGKVVAEGTLPQDTFSFGEAEWAASYALDEEPNPSQPTV